MLYYANDWQMFDSYEDLQGAVQDEKLRGTHNPGLNEELYWTSGSCNTTRREIYLGGLSSHINSSARHQCRLASHAFGSPLDLEVIESLPAETGGASTKASGAQAHPQRGCTRGDLPRGIQLNEMADKAAGWARLADSDQVDSCSANTTIYVTA